MGFLCRYEVGMMGRVRYVSLAEHEYLLFPLHMYVGRGMLHMWLCDSKELKKIGSRSPSYPCHALSSFRGFFSLRGVFEFVSYTNIF